MNRQDIYDLIVEILSKEYEIPAEKIKPESHIFEELNLDSLDAMDLLVDMERKFKIKISAERAKKIQTINDIIDFVLDIKNL